MQNLTLVKNFVPYKAQEYNQESNLYDLKDLAYSFVKLMYDHNMLYIIGPYVNIPYKFLAIRGYPQNFFCINLKIVYFSQEQIELEETAWYVPGLIQKVTRPKLIRTRFKMANGDVKTEKFEGLTARIIQQAYDELNGIPFFKGMSKLKFDFYVKKAKKKGLEINNKLYNQFLLK
jgi:peptide deformylase